MRTTSKFIGRLAASVALSAIVPGVAFAQDEAAASAEAPGDAPADDTIVVTGTLVRGVAPAGASPISVGTEAIEKIGATSVNQVLQTIPQLASFGSLQQPLAASPEVTVNRPNLRNLPGFNNGGGSSTLVMMDGHRMVGVGVASTTPDPDVIPPSVIQRVEIVPDGGSAIYGSDAVAGVMNFITIKRFDGVKVNGSYGFADNYYSYDANVLVGKDWGSGSIFAAYSYAKTDELLGRDRDYIREFPSANYSGTLVRQLNCSAGANFTYGSGTTAVVNRVNPDGSFTVNAANDCDGSDYATVFPESKRHSVFAGLTQQLDDSTSIEIRGYYTKRSTHIQNGGFGYQYSYSAQQGTPAPAPYNTAAITADNSQTVYGQLGPNGAATANISIETWGITPTVTKDLDGNFQLRVLGSYGESDNSFISHIVNPDAVNRAVSLGQFNPYRPDLASPTVVGAMTNFENFNHTRQNFYNARAVVDGSLFTMAGGDVKAAVGLEYLKESFHSNFGNSVPGFENSGYVNGGATDVIPSHNRLPRFNLSRNVKSAFGEVIIPFIGADNAFTGFQELRLSLAGRYDDYSDVGSTFNPRIGLTYKPVDWLSIHAAWGKSFNAPSLADAEQAAGSTVFVLPCSAIGLCPPADLVASGQYPAQNGRSNIVAVRGNAPGITPQKATTWSVGFDARPTTGLSFGLNYFAIDFKHIIGLAPFENGATLYRDFDQVINTGFTTQAEIDAIYNLRLQPGNSCGRCFGTPTLANTYAIIDARKNNLGAVKVSGLDFNLNYRGETGFGAVLAGTNGVYTFSVKRSPSEGAPYVETINFNGSRLRVRTNVGVEVGPLSAQAFWNHQSGYSLFPTVGIAGFTQQNRVESFNTIDLALRYEVGGEGWGQDLVFTANVNNVFDAAPPVTIAFDNIAGRRGTTNGNTLGRFVQFGVAKKF